CTITNTANVTRLTTTAATKQSATGGPEIYDVAHLTGGFGTYGGTITFVLYSDASCSTPLFSDTKSVSGNADVTSASFTPTKPGTYQWRASYSGDADNYPVGPGDCAD